MTTLPLPPYAALLIGVLLCSALIYGLLSLMNRRQGEPIWEGLSVGALTLAIPLMLIWGVIFVLSLYAVWAGLLHFIEDGQSFPLGLGGLIAALLGAPFLIWSTFLKTQSVRYQKEGHMTDRISKAVEQLGEEKTTRNDGVETTVPNIEVRIGAILSLERIAQDSTTHDNGRDHVRVMEILCAYIRENAPLILARDHPFGPWEPLRDDASDEERAAYKAKGEDWKTKVYRWAQTLPPPRQDIAMALDVIKRRKTAQRRVEAAWPDPPTGTTKIAFDCACPRLPERQGDGPLDEGALNEFNSPLDVWRESLKNAPGYRLDLRRCNLQAADLEHAELGGARLDKTRLEGANLSHARMTGVRLVNAQIDGATLFKAQMNGADLRDAKMNGAYLRYAELNGANLWGAQMVGAVLGEAKMNGANLWGAQMVGAVLGEAKMNGASLWSTQLNGASLWHARMNGADLSYANIDAVDFLLTQMEDVTLYKCSLETCVNLEREQLDRCFGDASVRLPIALSRPAHWPEWELPDWFYDGELAKWRVDPRGYTPPPPPDA